MRTPSIFGAALLLLISAGCGRPASVETGTTGTIRSGATLLNDIQVTVHRVSGNVREPIGFGISSLQGEFALLQPEASGPLWLEPGEYAFTLESVGPEPFGWPVEYTQPDKTPLVAQWSESDESLDLDVPRPHDVRPHRR